MVEPSASAGPLALAASFPPEPRFAATAAEIAARLAMTSGCSLEAAEEIRGAVDRAFRSALASPGAGEPGIDVAFKTTDGFFDADVASGGAAFCHCSRPRSA
jgi:hypothetical protein